jgi:GNAT superfamily N-acetyltransferase
LLKQFIRLPYRLHRSLSNWIPPLYLDQKNIFHPKTNRLLQHCEYQLFLLRQGIDWIGRIAVYINREANRYRNERIGYFGHYECTDDFDSSRLLLGQAESWLQERGMVSMRGPWNFVSQDMGLICEGYQVPPVILSSHNPPYYNEQMKAGGMHKVKDLLVYACDTAGGYRIPQRFVNFSEGIAKRYGVRIRSLNMKNLLQEARAIVRLTNESLQGNWGFYPVEESEAEQIARDLKLIIHPEAVLIAEVDDRPIGYLLALPDVNHILKNMNGRLFPIGLFKLFFGIKKLTRYRVWAMGIQKPYQQRGVSILLIRRLNEILAPRGVYVEANWVLEDNALMNNALRRMKFDMIKKYRIYEKSLTA